MEFRWEKDIDSGIISTDYVSFSNVILAERILIQISSRKTRSEYMRESQHIFSEICNNVDQGIILGFLILPICSFL